jgi:hypothetical protein
VRGPPDLPSARATGCSWSPSPDAVGGRTGRRTRTTSSLARTQGARCSPWALHARTQALRARGPSAVLPRGQVRASRLVVRAPGHRGPDQPGPIRAKKMSVGPFLASGAAMLRTAAKPWPRRSGSPPTAALRHAQAAGSVGEWVDPASDTNHGALTCKPCLLRLTETGRAAGHEHSDRRGSAGSRAIPVDQSGRRHRPTPWAVPADRNPPRCWHCVSFPTPCPAGWR